MGEVLKKRLKQGQIIGDPVQEFAYNVMVAADHVAGELERLSEQFGLSLGQFSVLRILRAAGGEGLPRGEIGARMVDRAPDVTRTIDKLEAMGLVVRAKGSVDKRQSLTMITEKGLDLLRESDPLFESEIKEFARILSMAEWIAANSLLERVYDYLGEKRGKTSAVSK